jgi:hypothetical protein
MPVVACPGCSNPLQLPDVPTSRPVVCDSCKMQIVMPFTPNGGSIPPDIPTPAPLPVVRLPEPPRPTGPEDEARRSGDPYGGFDTNTVLVVLVVLAAAAGLVLALTW